MTQVGCIEGRQTIGARPFLPPLTIFREVGRRSSHWDSPSPLLVPPNLSTPVSVVLFFEPYLSGSMIYPTLVPSPLTLSFPFPSPYPTRPLLSFFLSCLLSSCLLSSPSRPSLLRLTKDHVRPSVVLRKTRSHDPHISIKNHTTVSDLNHERYTTE